MATDAKVFNDADVILTQTRTLQKGAQSLRGRPPRVNQVATAKSNIVAAAPTANDDQTEGYSVWSSWLDSSVPRFYMCADASTGAAVWVALN